MTWLVDEYAYGRIEVRWGLRHEGLRKFVQFGKTGVGTKTPHSRTLQRYAEVFLEFHPLGFILEPKPDGTPAALQELKMVLPQGEAEALAYIEQVFRTARESGSGVPEGTEQLEEWMKKVVRAEYSVEKKYPRGRRD